MSLFEVLYFVNLNKSNFNNVIDHSIKYAWYHLAYFIPKVAKNIKYVYSFLMDVIFTVLVFLLHSALFQVIITVLLKPMR